MDSESGFFRSTDLRDAGRLGSHDRLSDFRLVYTSEKGLTRIFIAKKNGRLHVVKSLKQQYASDLGARAALRKEYDAAFLVESPYVARTYDFLDIEGYGPSIVMEYCPGHSLAEMMANHETLSDGDVRAIASGLLHGLDAIHAAGVVHRDIKPSNIIYLPSTRNLHIIDFGCADGGPFYLFNDAAGTPGYAAPELFSDDYKTSLKDDYYSAGMTLSAIAPLCPPASRSILSVISRQLLSGQRVDIDKVYDDSLRHRRWKSVAIALTALLIITIAAGYIFFRNNPDNTPAQTAAKSTEARQTPPAAADTLRAADRDRAGQQEEQPQAINDRLPDAKQPETPPTPAPIAAVERKEMYMKDGDARFPEVNGVGYHEAKYIVNYKRTDVDRVTVTHTDSYLLMNLIKMEKEKATKEERERAAEAFSNYDSLWNYVERHLVAQFSTFDRTRAKGLVFQRQRFWLEENYRPFIP